MEKNSITVSNERIKGQTNTSLTGIIFEKINSDVAEKNPVIEKLADEGHKVIVNYLEWLGLADDPNLIVLSPLHHFYYDDDDLKEVTTVINLKQLNHIKDIKEFLLTINHMLSSSSFFVGSFIDRKNHFWTPIPATQGKIDALENGIISRIPLLNMIYDFMDSRTNRNMTKKSVTLLLEDAGMKILDMTEMNGLTCFCCRRIAPPTKD
jgi:hypothetical protein